MEETIEVNFKYSEKEFITEFSYIYNALGLIRNVLYKITMTILLTYIVILNIIAYSTTKTFTTHFSFWIIMIFLFAVLIIWEKVYVPNWYKNLYHRDLGIQEGFNVKIGLEQLEFSENKPNPNSEVVEWNVYKRALKNNNSYFLKKSRRKFTVIPIRAFKDEEQIKQFEDIVTKKVGKLKKI